MTSPRPRGIATVTEIRALIENAATPAAALEGIVADADPVPAQDHETAKDQDRVHHDVTVADQEAGIRGQDPDREAVAGGVAEAAMETVVEAIGVLMITMRMKVTDYTLPIWIAMPRKGTWKKYLANTDPSKRFGWPAQYPVLLLWFSGIARTPKRPRVNVMELKLLGGGSESLSPDLEPVAWAEVGGAGSIPAAPDATNAESAVTLPEIAARILNGVTSALPVPDVTATAEMIAEIRDGRRFLNKTKTKRYKKNLKSLEATSSDRLMSFENPKKVKR